MFIKEKQINTKSKRCVTNHFEKKLLFFLKSNFIGQRDLHFFSWRTIYKFLKISYLQKNTEISKKNLKKNLKLIAKLIVNYNFSFNNNNQVKTIFKYLKKSQILKRFVIFKNSFNNILKMLNQCFFSIFNYFFSFSLILFNFLTRNKLCVYNE